jgi:hypothetical protein
MRKGREGGAASVSVVRRMAGQFGCQEWVLGLATHCALLLHFATSYTIRHAIPQHVFINSILC